MEIKTTLFAMFTVLVITWRNNRIANIEGKKYLPYGLDDAVQYIKIIKDKWRKIKK